MLEPSAPKHFHGTNVRLMASPYQGGNVQSNPVRSATASMPSTKMETSKNHFSLLYSAFLPNKRLVQNQIFEALSLLVPFLINHLPHRLWWAPLESIKETSSQ